MTNETTFQTKSGNTYYIHPDTQGSIPELIAEMEKIEKRLEHYAFLKTPEQVERENICIENLRLYLNGRKCHNVKELINLKKHFGCTTGLSSLASEFIKERGILYNQTTGEMIN